MYLNLSFWITKHEFKLQPPEGERYSLSSRINSSFVREFSNPESHEPNSRLDVNFPAQRCITLRGWWCGRRATFRAGGGVLTMIRLPHTTRGFSVRLADTSHCLGIYWRPGNATLFARVLKWVNKWRQKVVFLRFALHFFTFLVS